MEFIDQVVKEYDSRYCLVVSKDHNRGIVVQVARMNPTQVADSDGTMSKVHRPVILLQRIVSLVVASVNRDPQAMVFKAEDVVKAELTALIHQADEFAAKCIASENSSDTILTELGKAFKPHE